MEPGKFEVDSTSSPYRPLKIGLIRPPRVIPNGSFQGQQGVPPIGLAYVAAALLKSDYKVYCIDAVGEQLDQFQPHPIYPSVIQGLSLDQIVSRIHPDTTVIAVSMMFSSETFYVFELCAKIAELFPGILFVFGGEASSADYEYVHKAFPNCIVCHGEGEETIVELCSFLANKTELSLRDIQGISFQMDGQIVLNARRARNKKLDLIALPAWDQLPLEKYLSKKLGSTTRDKRTIPMLASRGCPFSCTFCSNAEMWTTFWNYREPQKVIEEIQSYVKKYSIEHVEFYDLTMIVNKNWIMKFCQLLIEAKIGITWSLPSGTRSEVLDQDTIPLLKESGCTRIAIAPESGSKRILKLIDKRVNLEKMLSSIRICAAHGVHTKAHMIYAFPGETRADLFANFFFVLRMAMAGLNDCTTYRFTPYPGSKLFKELEKQNRFPKDFEQRNQFLSGSIPNSIVSSFCWTDKYSNLELTLAMFFSMLSFYLASFLRRPLTPFVLLYNIVTNQPSTLVDLLIVDILSKQVKRIRKVLNGFPYEMHK